MEKAKTIFYKFTDLMDENTKGVKIGCYSVALIGLTIAIRRVRPFTRFKKPSDIPNRFIQERRELAGVVERIEPSGALLMVRHKPLIPLPFSNNSALPVKVSGLSITGNGISWLQVIVVGQEIKFIPVLKEKNYVQSEVLLEQQTHDKKLRVVNIGESLLSVGFGALEHIEKPLSNVSAYHKYYNRLKIAENNSIRKQLGLRYYIKPTKVILSGIGKSINKVVAQVLKPAKKAPNPKLAISS